MVRCFNRHRIMVMNHTIDSAGKVEPSICCPSCNWHSTRTVLEGWSA